MTRSTPRVIALGLLLLSSLLAVSCEKRQQPGRTEGPFEQGTSQIKPLDPSVPVQPAGTPRAQHDTELEQITVILEVTTHSAYPRFEPNELTVKPGEIVSLTFRNRNVESDDHGLIITQPGKADEVGRAATRSGPSRDWTPSREVAPLIIARTRLLSPGESDTITFRAPQEPGDFPFICPTTRHWSVMRGVLHVSQD